MLIQVLKYSFDFKVSNPNILEYEKQLDDYNFNLLVAIDC